MWKPSSFSILWKQGLLSVTFVDDSYLQGATKIQSNQNVNATINLRTSLGLTIHYKQSVSEPAQSTAFLGSIIYSITLLLFNVSQNKHR